ncbi:hypothetical protein RJ641_016567 [Dillenia turbinata]|uniref:Uncharacterized protein n=1 Tax=Dillenia turbinata TaxID=194707 RepID=A0AAN8UM61_9MAGN
MKSEDKKAFFEGLEKNIEKENEKLANLHDWLHSNTENLDYGAGIEWLILAHLWKLAAQVGTLSFSNMYIADDEDAPEKVIPRRKGSSNGPEFIKNLVAVENAKPSYPVKKDEEHHSETCKSLVHEHVPSSSAAYDPKNKFLNNQRLLLSPVMALSGLGKNQERSIGNIQRKSLEGFESYNAATDPDVKSVMRDKGKDLDRWITEKEVQEAAELMDKIPMKGQKFIKKKVRKLKREMELFGPQAVVSKYSEYAEEKEEDYLWWLDLPCVLCIGLYTIEDGKQKIGLYSLEMAPNLELESKQYHVIAFEDAGDCKNLWYII